MPAIDLAADDAVQGGSENRTGQERRRQRHEKAARDGAPQAEPFRTGLAAHETNATPQATRAAPTQIGSQCCASCGTDSSATAHNAVMPIAIQPLPGTVVNAWAASIVSRM